MPAGDGLYVVYYGPYNRTEPGQDFTAMIVVTGFGENIVIKVPRAPVFIPLGTIFNWTLTAAQHAAMEKLVPTPGKLLAYFKSVLLDQLPPVLRVSLKAYIEWLFVTYRTMILREIIRQLKKAPGGPPTCAIGSHWDVNLEKCVPDDPPPHTCPAGQHWDETLQKCVPDPPPPPHVCPPGQHWDPELAKCVPNVSPPPPGDGSNEARNKILARLADCVCTIEQVLGAAAADDCLCRIAAAVEAIASTGSPDLSPLTAQVKRVADADNGYPPDSAAARAQIKSLMDVAVKKYGFPAELGQLITG